MSSSDSWDDPDAQALLERAEAARADGDVTSCRDHLLAAFRIARASGDTAVMAAAALGLPAQGFGREAGQVPALLYEAYLATDDLSLRARLAAALARAWVYGGEPHRAVPFAIEAERLASGGADPTVLADALEAALTASWGPDQLAARIGLSARLVDAVAHLSDPDLRLQAHLWRLTTAWECLDVVAVQRQLRALDLLTEESGTIRVAFYTVSRRAMHALAVSDLDSARSFMARAASLGSQLADADIEAVVYSLAADLARQLNDREALREQAESFEQFGSAEGIQSVQAEAAVFWLEAGEPERAQRLARQAGGEELAAVPRDVDFLLTVSSLSYVASGCDLPEMAHEAATLLESYSGRAIINAGSVSFHGVVDDYVYRAHRAAGDTRADRWRDTALNSYRRIGATWWADRLMGVAPMNAPVSTQRPQRLRLYRSGTGFWTVGADVSLFSMPDLRGLHYLRSLLDRPGMEISALELSNEASGHPGTSITQRTYDRALDATAKAAYKRRLDEVDDEIAEAEAWSDLGRVERAERERDALIAELTTASGLGGRSRWVGATEERARVAVRRAVATALQRIESHDAPLARLLRDTVHTGMTCRYDADPARPVEWVLDSPGTEFSR